MTKRRRIKQALSLSERLVRNVDRLEKQLEMLPPGPERDHIAKQIRQNQAAANIDRWLTSPGLQPPQEIKNLGK